MKHVVRLLYALVQQFLVADAALRREIYLLGLAEVIPFFVQALLVDLQRVEQANVLRKVRDEVRIPLKLCNGF